MGSPDIILNGRPVNGRTHQDENGYESLDLVQVGVGDEIVLFTDQGSHTLIKGDDQERSGALDGWARLRRESALGVTTLVLLEHNPHGASFLTPRVVLQRGIEVGAIDPLSDEPNVIRSLGVVANIAYRSAKHKESMIAAEELAPDLV